MTLDPLDYSGNVHHWAGRYHHLSLARRTPLDRDDLAQVGWVAVLVARRAHEKNGHPAATFPGYVTPSIRRDMGRAFDRADRCPRYEDPWSAIDDAIEGVPDAPRDDAAEDAAARLLSVLTDRQARAVELHLGLDGSPPRTVAAVADLMGYASLGSCARVIKAGLDNLRRHHNPNPTR